MFVLQMEMTQHWRKPHQVRSIDVEEEETNSDMQHEAQKTRLAGETSTDLVPKRGDITGGQN